MIRARWKKKLHLDLRVLPSIGKNKRYVATYVFLSCSHREDCMWSQLVSIDRTITSCIISVEFMHLAACGIWLFEVRWSIVLIKVTYFLLCKKKYDFTYKFSLSVISSNGWNYMYIIKTQNNCTYISVLLILRESIVNGRRN